MTPKKTVIKSVKSTKAGKITVSWKKDSKASGYKILYATNKNMKKTLSKLKRGKTYYVKVCAYKTVKGKKIAGPYSAVKKVKVKR